MPNDFEINHNDLDGELLRLASLYEDWARKAANAKSEQGRIHLRRKILKARLYKESRELFEKAGKKPTGSDLEAEIRTNEEYQIVSQELIDAEEKTDLMEAGKWAIVEKSKAVLQLCDDRARGFKIPSSSYAAVQDESHKAQVLRDVDAGLRDKINKKKINRG